MEKTKIRKLEVTIPRWVAEHWCVVCYLIINWRISDLVKQIQVKPGKEFYDVTAKYLYDYAVNDKMPPSEIAPTIMNLAEDFMSGNPVKFRPGDYIVMQNFIRKRK
ncbi:MAG: hypothetical protein JSW60_06420 [Thermoplasmatales archaeon]|nr:MAG: hypothetical protein JSW60_06420 [Thermoplasmatales archaeon]